MNLIEVFLKDELFIDFDCEVMYGDDQCYLSYPCRFPAVTFQLVATNGLSRIADRVRKDAGFKPMHAMDEYTDDTCDNEGWYDFYFGLNGFADNHIDNGLVFIVVNTDSEDNEAMYTIDLTLDAQDAIYARLDEQCRQHLGKGCEALFDETRKLMEEDTAHEHG